MEVSRYPTFDGDANPSLPGSFLVREVSDPPSERRLFVRPGCACDLVRDAAPHLAAPDGVVEAILPEISIGQDGGVGPSRPGNPLAVFILDFLYWPHDKVSHDVGYLDTSIFRRLHGGSA
jgi:hypothetical protein